MIEDIQQSHLLIEISAGDHQIFRGLWHKIIWEVDEFRCGSGFRLAFSRHKRIWGPRPGDFNFSLVFPIAGKTSQQILQLGPIGSLYQHADLVLQVAAATTNLAALLSGYTKTIEFVGETFHVLVRLRKSTTLEQAGLRLQILFSTAHLGRKTHACRQDENLYSPFLTTLD